MNFAYFALPFACGTLAFAGSELRNPRGYSLEVLSGSEAIVKNAGNQTVRKLRCESALQPDGSYRLSCPDAKNKGAGFQSVLKYDQEEDSWGAEPMTGKLRMGKEEVYLDCSAGGTGGQKGGPSFHQFGCTFANVKMQKSTSSGL